ncbi:MAG: hypothetical protein M1399_09990 [Actinobacteria bacterium]|nr:hypothetical protein [Actinomycetota bacterium]
MSTAIFAVNLWNPAHVGGLAILLIAFLLGVVHGITPDEHTWPITFSYAIGGYSTKKGLRAGLIFSFAFTLQRAIASELAYLGFSRIFTFGSVDYVVYIVVGLVMAVAGVMIVHRGRPFHLHLPGLASYKKSSLHTGTHVENDRPAWIDDPRPWMPAVHGFIAGWGFGAFALILYTTLSPAMHSIYLGWVPGALFGIGTMVVQVIAGMFFGWWASRRGLSEDAIRQVALRTAANTLKWGGLAFLSGGIFGLAFPGLAGTTVSTGIHVHNLDHLGLPIVLVIVAVVLVGFITLAREMRAWKEKEAVSAGGEEAVSAGEQPVSGKGEAAIYGQT